MCFAIGNSVGLKLAIAIFLSLSQQLDLADLPEYMQGIPAALNTASILCMAFMRFAGLVYIKLFANGMDLFLFDK